MADIKHCKEKVTKQVEDVTKDTATEIKNESPENNKNNVSKYSKNTNLFILICIIVVITGIAIEMFKNIRANKKNAKPKYWILSNLKNEDYVLKHVHTVLERFEYERSSNNTPWDLLWSHNFPFNILDLRSLQPHQKVNHFPGSYRITEKVDFVTNESKNVPKSFRLPKDKENFLKYASDNKKAIFVEKDNQHRGVVLKNLSDVDTRGGKFVQEYIQNPLLVDGYKFDIGVYVAITSVNPLRIYYYNGDVLLRFCPEKYYPFDPLNVEKYVVADKYRPIYEVPALAQMHNMGYSMKDSLDIYLRAQGKDPNKMWEDVYKTISDNLVNKEKYIIEALKKYSSSSNFFEMYRVDLMVDEDMKVYLMEANMSPNLVSPRPTNQLLYEQVLYNLFSLVGLGGPFRNYHSSYTQIDCGDKLTNPGYSACVKNKAGAQMMAADKNIAVWGADCSNSPEGKCDGVCATCRRCLTSSDRLALIEAYREHRRKSDFRRLFPPPMCDGVCATCRRCLTSSDRLALIEAYREHRRRSDFRRLFPPPMTPKPTIGSWIEDLEDLTPKNRLMYLWYQGKCNVDVTWCN